MRSERNSPTRRSAQEGRHLRFPPSCESPLSLEGSGADCRHVTVAKWGNGSRVTAAFVSPPFRSSQTAYCYTDRKISAGRGIAVPRNSLTRYTARHLRIKRLVQFILVGAVYNNALKNRATLLCRACLDEITCVAVMYLTLRIC